MTVRITAELDKKVDIETFQVTLYVRKLRLCRLGGMAILVDDSAEPVLPIYGEEFDLIEFERLNRTPQVRLASE